MTIHTLWLREVCDERARQLGQAHPDVRKAHDNLTDVVRERSRSERARIRRRGPGDN